MLLAPLRASLEHERAREAEERAHIAESERPATLPKRQEVSDDIREGVHETTLMESSLASSTDPSPITVQSGGSKLRKRISQARTNNDIEDGELSANESMKGDSKNVGVENGLKPSGKRKNLVREYHYYSDSDEEMNIYNKRQNGVIRNVFTCRECCGACPADCCYYFPCCGIYWLASFWISFLDDMFSDCSYRKSKAALYEEVEPLRKVGRFFVEFQDAEFRERTLRNARHVTLMTKDERDKLNV